MQKYKIVLTNIILFFLILPISKVAAQGGYPTPLPTIPSHPTPTVTGNNCTCPRTYVCAYPAPSVYTCVKVPQGGAPPRPLPPEDNNPTVQPSINPTISPYPHTASTCRADFNNDGIYNGDDFLIIKTEANSQACIDDSPGTVCRVDLNEDLVYDGDDFLIIKTEANSQQCLDTSAQ